jgi:hypothetical protein
MCDCWRGRALRYMGRHDWTVSSLCRTIGYEVIPQATQTIPMPKIRDFTDSIRAQIDEHYTYVDKD